MKLIIQHVSSANVKVGERLVGKIDHGYLVLVGIGQNDNQQTLKDMSEKLLKLRVIPDQNDKMNLSIQDIQGELLLISQFTLYADTKKGNRPSFTHALEPIKAQELFNQFTNIVKQSGLKVQTGEFGAIMDVSLINAGPITIILEN